MEHFNFTETPIVNQQSQLKKYSGKGGWTFAVIPDLPIDKHAYFGWVKVSGSIDGYEIKKSHLMSMNGMMFLPVKAEIRKKIGKKEGDWVQLILYSEQIPPVEYNDFMICLKDDPTAYQNYLKKPESEQKAFTDYIYSAKEDKIKVERIAEILNKLSQ
jgi:bifunctional DNA-binding transcriptional regulator/antitoxin component of YhaV-PrlF toxin-antitoxin module